MIKESVAFKGIYKFEHWRDGCLLDAWADKNLIPTESLNSMLGIHMHADAQLVAWYMGLGSGNYTADPTDTAANIVARVTEVVAYAGNRPAVTFAAAAAGAITNSAAKATFTVNAPIATVTNAFIVSTATGSGGTILSSIKLATAKTGFVSGDQIVVTYTMTAASV